MRFRICLLAIFCAALCSPARAQSSATPDIPYAVGADVSFLKQAEDQGAVFKDAGTAKPGLQILREHGYSWIRLRLFVNPAAAPTHLPNDLAYTIDSIRRAKALGFKVELGLHYSDTWSDRFHELTPAAWAGQTHEQLTQSVFAYTRDTLAALRQADAFPDMLQFGNEPTLGFLWPDGRLPENWDHYADLYRAAVRGLDAGRGPLPRPLLLVQLDLGGDWDATHAWFDRFFSYHLPVDILGESYYAHDYHSLLELRRTLFRCAEVYNRDVIVIETSYNWKPGKAFPAGDGPFPETPAGQAAFLDALNDIVLSVPGGHGKGVFWWEPFWPRREPRPGQPASGASERGMVDDDGNMLPVIRIFDKWTGGNASRTHTPLATPQLTGPAASSPKP